MQLNQLQRKGEMESKFCTMVLYVMQSIPGEDFKLQCVRAWAISSMVMLSSNWGASCEEKLEESDREGVMYMPGALSNSFAKWEENCSREGVMRVLEIDFGKNFQRLLRFSRRKLISFSVMVFLLLEEI